MGSSKSRHQSGLCLLGPWQSPGTTDRGLQRLAIPSTSDRIPTRSSHRTRDRTSLSMEPWPQCGQWASTFSFAPHSGQNLALASSDASQYGTRSANGLSAVLLPSFLSSSAIAACAHASSTLRLACAEDDLVPHARERILARTAPLFQRLLRPSPRRTARALDELGLERPRVQRQTPRHSARCQPAERTRSPRCVHGPRLKPGRNSTRSGCR